MPLPQFDRNPAYEPSAAMFTFKWCAQCDRRKIVQRTEPHCKDCGIRLMPVPEQRRERGVHDLRALADVMAKQGVSQYLLGRELRITRSHISRLQKGEALATKAAAQRIADVLQCKVSHLTGEKEL